MMRPWLPGVLVVAMIVAPAQAHHSFAKFDLQRSIEIEGEVTEVRWQNPHIQFTLVTHGADGAGSVVWLLETNSPGILRRAGIDDGNVKVGDLVKVAGNPAVEAAAHRLVVLRLQRPRDGDLRLGE